MFARIKRNAFLLILIGLFAACTSTVGQEQLAADQALIVSQGEPVLDYIDLIDNLRALGLTVEPAGTFTSQFFSGKPLVIKVNGEDIQVYEYSDGSIAAKEAGYLSPDGGEIAIPEGPVIMANWLATPHFFRNGRLIVQYIGDNPELIARLESLLGPQFAGGKSEGSLPLIIGTPEPVAISPTSGPTEGLVEGWPVYHNEFYAYQISYPPSAEIRTIGVDTAAEGDEPEGMPKGLSFDEYVEQLRTVYPENICVTINYEVGFVSILAPRNKGGKYVGLCGIGGIGAYDVIEKTETITIDGRTYLAEGTELREQDAGAAFRGEYFFVELEDGTWINYGGGLDEAISYEEYLLTKKILRQIVTSYRPETTAETMIPTSPSLSSLIDDLRAAGVAVEPGEMFTPDIFTAQGQYLTVNGAPIPVYEYADADLAATEAAWVSPDGNELTFPDPNNPGQMVSLINEPSGSTIHYYRRDNIMLQYVGDSLPIINALEAVLGPQVAGGSAPKPGTIPPLYGHGLLPTPELVYDSQTLIPPAWLKIGDNVILASSGGYEITDKGQGLVQRADPVPPHLLGEALATAHLGANQAATVIVYIPYGSVQFRRVKMQLWSEEPVFDPQAGWMVLGQGQQREDFYTYALEPIDYSNLDDTLLTMTLLFDNAQAGGEVSYLWHLNPPSLRYPTPTPAPFPGDFRLTLAATPLEGAALLTVQFTASFSGGPDNSFELNCAIVGWEMGDGVEIPQELSCDKWTPDIRIGRQYHMEYTYAQAGTYQVRAQVVRGSPVKDGPETRLSSNVVTITVSSDSITITGVGVSGGRVVFAGQSTLPEGTCLQTQLFASDSRVTWWPKDTCAAVQYGRWRMVVRLGQAGTPAELDPAIEYALQVWQRDNPLIRSEMFPFDLAGPPPAQD